MAINTGESTLKHMRNAAGHLSEMLEHTVSEVRRLQKKHEANLGRKFESTDELFESYDTKNMKELTAILKDVAAVEKALQENSASKSAEGITGVVLLPQVELELSLNEIVDT